MTNGATLNLSFSLFWCLSFKEFDVKGRTQPLSAGVYDMVVVFYHINEYIAVYRMT